MTAAFQLERLETPLGRMLIVTDTEHRLRAIDWEDHEQRMQRLLALQYRRDAVQLRKIRAHSAATDALGAYFAGDLNAISDLPTATGGTDFQRQVWAALRLIPTGQTLSYGALAARIGRPTAVRAVG